MATSKEKLEQARTMLVTALDLVEDVYDQAMVGGAVEEYTSRAADNTRAALSNVEEAQRAVKP